MSVQEANAIATSTAIIGRHILLEWLASWYDDPTEARSLYAEHETVTRLARDFGGASYDLSDPGQRARFEQRLLSVVHPVPRDLLQELARTYHERFGRPLPVSSLVRTQRYQRRLGGINPNATRVEIPPHTTGMAFDNSYKFMSADEQNDLMGAIAQLEKEGRVEAVRERRNVFHTYAFANGHPPTAARIRAYLDDVEKARAGGSRRARSRRNMAK